MLRRRRYEWLAIFLALAAVGLAGGAQAREPGWDEYRALLAAHLRPVTLDGITLAGLDYGTIRASGALDPVVASLEGVDLGRLQGHQERMAFYLNAYNILAIRMVLDHWPLESIKDVGSWFTPVWKQPAGHLGGRAVTLHEIEHEILRPMGDPRIHAAIVCASRSCPDLRAKPYEAARLDEQLDDQMRDFLENPAKGLTLIGDEAHISRIFDWFEEDFGELDRFIRRYRPDLPSEVRFEADLPYNWLLNIR